jgi:hypothetical protein
MIAENRLTQKFAESVLDVADFHEQFHPNSDTNSLESITTTLRQACLLCGSSLLENRNMVISRKRRYPDDWRYPRVDPRDHICLRDVGRSGGLDVRGRLELGLGWSFESDAGAWSLKLMIDCVDCTVYISVINVVQNTAARIMSVDSVFALIAS